MLLQTPVEVENRCPRWWSFAAACGFLSLAVLGSGVSLRAMAAPTPDDEKKVIIVTIDKDGAIKADASKKVISVIAKDGKVVKQVPVEKKVVVVVQDADSDTKAPTNVEKRVTVVAPDGVRHRKVGDAQEVRHIVLGVLDDEDQKKEKKGEKKEGEKRSKTWNWKFDFDVDGVLKNLPENVDKERLRKEIKEAMEKAHKAIESATREARKAAEDGAPEARKAAAEALRMLQKEQGQLGEALQQRMRALKAVQRVAGETDESSHGRLGIHVEQPSATLADQLDLPEGRGLVVTSVQADSAAAKAGIKVSDILLEVAGEPVSNSPEALIKQVQELKAGASFNVTVLRKGKKETIRGVKVAQGEVRRRTTVKEAPEKGFKTFKFEAPKVQGFKLAVPEGQGGHGVMTTVFRTDRTFTTRHQEGSLIITITGKVDEGNAKISSIEVQDGSSTKKYRNVNQVPEQYRDKVQNLVEMNEKSNVKVEIKTSTKEKEKREPRRKEKQEEEDPAARQ